MPYFRNIVLLTLAGAVAACAVRIISASPRVSPRRMNASEERAMLDPGLPRQRRATRRSVEASLWSAGKRSLLGDRRAARRGDIMTVVIEIDEEAQISNATQRSRSGSEDLAIPDLFGLPQRVNPDLPDGASLDRPSGSSPAAGPAAMAPSGAARN